MKKTINFLVVLLFVITLPCITVAQVDIDKKAEKETNEAIDDGIKKFKGMFKKKDKNKDKETQSQTPQDQGGTNDEPTNETDIPTEPEAQEADKGKKPELTWAKYDFVPGEKVFFEDNLVGEENGEFPSRWDIISGNVENARLGNDKVIMFRADSYIIPYLDNPEQDYLPDVFTLEFDCYFHENEHNQGYWVYFYDKKNQPYIKDLDHIIVYWNFATYKGFKGYYPGVSNSAYAEVEGWKHVSISFNKRALKVYLDDTRLLNIPNITANPTGITIWGDYNLHNEICSYIKNIRLAEGGAKLYDRMIQDGKIIATGIRFDTGKSTLKPESMGIINEVAELMVEHPEINFSVEGHTDGDGDESFNLKLSEDRAQVVVNELVARGIPSDRLQAKGFGETNPVAPNATPEGKANNRRVEFVII